MSYRLEIRPDAVEDLEATANWYEAQQADLGTDFVRTVLAAIESLPQNPLIYQIRERRRMCAGFCRLGFPTGLFIEYAMISLRSLPCSTQLVTAENGDGGCESTIRELTPTTTL